MLHALSTIITTRMDILSTSLLERYRLRTLAHFYLLQAREETQLIEWAKNFLLKVLSDEGANLKDCERRLTQGHPDILWLTPSENSYKVDNKDFDPLFLAMAHKPLELPWRFIIVEKPETIGDVYANKLLKTLEEPNPACTIIFLHSDARPLMATIESRAIKLRLQDEQQRQIPEVQKEQSLTAYLQAWSAAFPEYYEQSLELPETPAALANELSTLSRKEPKIEANLVTGILTWAQATISDVEVLENIIQSNKHHGQSTIFHNSSAERFFNLVHALSP